MKLVTTPKYDRRNGAGKLCVVQAEIKELEESLIMSSLGEEFPREQARLRELIKAYRDIGPPGAFGAAAIEATLKEADQAALSGDLPRMIQAYQAMQGCE